MKKQYFFLKIIRFVIILIMIVILGFLLNLIYKESFKEVHYYNSLPQVSVWLYLILYIPVMIAGIWILCWNRNKLKKAFPDKYPPRWPLTKKVLTRIIVKVILLVVSFFVLILLIAPFGTIYLLTSHHVFYRNNSLLQMTYKASEFNLKENIHTLVTEDNYNIWASEITVDNPKAIIIYLTGIEQPSITQFYAHAKFMKDNGYASILLEVRGHGKSDGEKICLGYEEILDVKAALDYIKSNNIYDNIPIIIHGVSMGGAIATNAFGQYEEIDALIGMSTFSTFEDVIIENLKYYGIPSVICAIEKPIFKLALKTSFGTEKVDEMNPITQIQNSNGRPIFLVAAEGDTSVPVDNLKRLSAVVEDEDIWIKDSWEHFIVKDCKLNNVSEDKEYCEKILGFLRKVEDEYHLKN